MGFFSSALGIAGAVLGGPAGVVASGLGTYLNNREKQKATERANNQSIELANTAHQREVADLKAAGLNPILSAHNSGSATPNMAVYDPENTVNSALARKRLHLEEKDVLSRIELNNSTAEKQRAEQRLIEQQAITEESKRRYMSAQTLLTKNQAEKVAIETREILPKMRDHIQAQIDKIGDERVRIRVQNALDEASIWQIYEMTFVAKAQLEINKDNAVSNRISAGAAATSASAAKMDAEGRKDAGYYDAQSGKNITAALGDLAQIIGFVVSKGRF